MYPLTRSRQSHLLDHTFLTAQCPVHPPDYPALQLSAVRDDTSVHEPLNYAVTPVRCRLQDTSSSAVEKYAAPAAPPVVMNRPAMARLLPCNAALLRRFLLRCNAGFAACWRGARGVVCSRLSAAPAGAPGEERLRARPAGSQAIQLYAPQVQHRAQLQERVGQQFLVVGALRPRHHAAQRAPAGAPASGGD